MNPDQIILSAVVVVLVIAWLVRPAKRMVGGIFVRDRKGRMTLVLTPVPKSKRRRRRR